MYTLDILHLDLLRFKEQVSSHRTTVLMANRHEDAIVPFDDAPDDTFLAVFITVFGIYKRWRIPAGLGLLALRHSGHCREERALGQRHEAVRSCRTSAVFCGTALILGIVYQVMELNSSSTCEGASTCVRAVTCEAS